MNEIIQILMRRDGITENEAIEMINNCQEEIDYIASHDGTYDEVEEALRYWLGLEPDYLMYFV